MKRLLAALAVLMPLSACASDRDLTTGPTPTGDEYEVLATAYPLYEIAARLGGDRFHASNLRPEGALSDAPLTDAERRRILEAKVLFIPGGGLQPGIEAAAAERTGRTVVLNGGGDERFPWLDPNQMGNMIEEARVALSAYDSNGAGLYKRNATRYGRNIARLDKNMARTLATCERRAFVTTEPVYDALTDRYGLEQIDASTPERLRALVEQFSPDTVFFSDLPPLAEAQRRLAEGGYRSAVLSPVVDQSDQARRGGANYEVFMNLNLDALSAALGCTEDSERK